MDFGSQDFNIQNIQIAPNYVDVTGTIRAGIAEDVPLYDATQIFEVRAYCMFDKVIAFDETSGSIRSEYEVFKHTVFVNYVLSNHSFDV